MAEGTSQLLSMHIHTHVTDACTHTKIKVKLGFDFKENTENCR